VTLKKQLEGEGVRNHYCLVFLHLTFLCSAFSFLDYFVILHFHELVRCMFVGDFAMLLNAGMSAKQALVYNCVSSVLCMLGMVFGVAVGNISSATSWIFALIAGLFLYVALVDMVVSCLLTTQLILLENIFSIGKGKILLENHKIFEMKLQTVPEMVADLDSVMCLLEFFVYSEVHNVGNERLIC